MGYEMRMRNHAVINGNEFKLMGSVWEFQLQGLTKQQQKIIQFGLDTGFGELNSLGFGFINVAEHLKTRGA